ncbi:MAG TPA: hypothetical protein VKZ49_06550 [Polyangiaceae bacterium]|nr:hypothetical protein [Polyangiaceae bacterium]
MSPTPERPDPKPELPTLVAIDMGYGHLRPARALSKLLNVPVLQADLPPLADIEERRRWAAIRQFYETVSRVSTAGYVGGPFRLLLDTVTAIPDLYPFRDLSSRTLGVRAARRRRSRLDVSPILRDAHRTVTSGS